MRFESFVDVIVGGESSVDVIVGRGSSVDVIVGGESSGALWAILPWPPRGVRHCQPMAVLPIAAPTDPPPTITQFPQAAA